LKFIIFLYKIDPILLGAGIYTPTDIEKAQNLTRISKYSDIIINYATLATTLNGDLICISSPYSGYTYYYYGLKKNGRSYFLKNGEETYSTSITSDQKRNEGTISSIKLNSTSDDKEYVIAFGDNAAYFELYDFDDNNRVYKIDGKTFFGTTINPFHYSSVFKLKKEKYIFIISIIAKISTTNTFFLMKCLFYNKDISTYYPIKTNITESCAESATSSCFESENNFIFCFFLKDTSKYKIAVYHYNLTELTSTFIDPIYYSDKTIFHRSVHFIEDAGAFAYVDSDETIAIQFKKYNGEIIENYFVTKFKIKITNNNYEFNSKKADMIKLKNKKFCLSTFTTDETELNIFIIDNYLEEKIKIRHYIIKTYSLYKLKIREELHLSLYNDLIAMTFGGLYDSSSTFSYSMVVSYPNSTDFSIDITDNLISFVNPILQLYEKCNIENNIFGYYFSGYIIYNFTY